MVIVVMVVVRLGSAASIRRAGFRFRIQERIWVKRYRARRPMFFVGGECRACGSLHWGSAHAAESIFAAIAVSADGAGAGAGRGSEIGQREVMRQVRGGIFGVGLGSEALGGLECCGYHIGTGFWMAQGWRQPAVQFIHLGGVRRLRCGRCDGMSGRLLVFIH